MTAQKILLAFLLSLFVASQADAQFGGFGGLGGGRNRGERSQSNDDSKKDGAKSCPPDGLSYDQLEYRLNLFEEDLHLQDAQRAAWRAFADKVRAYGADVARDKARASMTSASTGGLQHLGAELDSARNRLTALEDIDTTARAFYKQLTDDQKTLADRRIPTFVAPKAMNLGRATGGDDPSGAGNDPRSRH